MVKINSFQFGSLTINNKKYDSDVILFWDGELIERESSHTLSKNDLIDLLIKEPDTIIIGTGTAGCVNIDKEAQEYARKNNLDIIIQKTPEAIECFNKMAKLRKVAAIFHLTC